MSTSDEINSIKNLYTMASEHLIHDKVSHADGEVDLFEDDDKEVDNEDDDNLELF